MPGSWCFRLKRALGSCEGGTAELLRVLTHSLRASRPCWYHSPLAHPSARSLAQKLPDFSSAFSCPTSARPSTPAPAQDRSQLARTRRWAVVLWEGQTENVSGYPVPRGTVAPCGESSSRLRPSGPARQHHLTHLQAAVLFGCPKAGAIVGRQS